MSRFFNAFSLVLCLALCACGKQPIGLDPGVKVLPYQTLPPPSRADQISPGRPYLLGPFDKLKISVFGVEELEQELQTDASGRFSYPLIGTVDSSGLTPDELKNELARRLARYIRNPQVSVNLAAPVSQVVTVEGQVKLPGLYPVMGNMTLVRAVATAGGVGEFASLDDVVVFRKIDGQRYAALYNLKAIRRGNYEDPPIYPNDVVIVGDSSARRMFRDIVTTLPVLTTPIIMLANGSN